MVPEIVEVNGVRVDWASLATLTPLTFAFAPVAARGLVASL